MSELADIPADAPQDAGASAEQSAQPQPAATTAEPKPPVSKWAIHRRLYDWVLHWAETPYGVPALFVISFAESSFFPIPPDVLLVALVLGAMNKWWKFAAWCTVASVLGGLLGYGIGVFAWETVGVWIVENLAHMNLKPVDGQPGH